MVWGVEVDHISACGEKVSEMDDRGSKNLINLANSQPNHPPDWLARIQIEADDDDGGGEGKQTSTPSLPLTIQSDLLLLSSRSNLS